jgi:hypothetical protein
VVGAGLQATQQLCGFNALMYYSASIFATLGYRNGTAVGLVIAIVNFIFTLVALHVRPVLFSGPQNKADVADGRLFRQEKDDALHRTNHGCSSGTDSRLLPS